MDKKLETAFNEQIKNELYSAYLYFSMAAYCDAEGLDGFAHWMKQQANEEFLHASKMYTFINDRGGRVILQAIDQPPSDFSSVVNIFEETLRHEQYVTSLINDLYKLARELNDSASEIFLQWFITEQVEEEKTASGILGQLKRLKTDSAAILMLDRTMMQRQAPVAAE